MGSFIPAMFVYEYVHTFYKLYINITYIYFSSLNRTHLGRHISKVSKLFLMKKPQDVPGITLSIKEH